MDTLIKNGTTSSEMQEFEVTAGSRNIFVDLNLPNPDARLAKVRLSVIINNAIDAENLTKSQAAKMLGVTPARVTALQNYALRRFSLFSLMKCVAALGYDVNIKLEPNNDTSRSGQIEVIAA